MPQDSQAAIVVGEPDEPGEAPVVVAVDVTMRPLGPDEPRPAGNVLVSPGPRSPGEFAFLLAVLAETIRDAVRDHGEDCILVPCPPPG